MSEPIEDEVNEELRRQQLKSIWDRFGIYIIGLAVLIILSVGGNEILNHLNNRVSQRESIAFDNAPFPEADGPSIVITLIFCINFHA